MTRCVVLTRGCVLSPTGGAYNPYDQRGQGPPRGGGRGGRSVLAVLSPNKHARVSLTRKSALDCRDDERTFVAPSSSTNMLVSWELSSHYVRWENMKVTHNSVARQIQDACFVCNRGGFNNNNRGYSADRDNYGTWGNQGMMNGRRSSNEGQYGGPPPPMGAQVSTTTPGHRSIHGGRNSMEGRPAHGRTGQCQCPGGGGPVHMKGAEKRATPPKVTNFPSCSAVIVCHTECGKSHCYFDSDEDVVNCIYHRSLTCALCLDYLPVQNGPSRWDALAGPAPGVGGNNNRWDNRADRGRREGSGGRWDGPQRWVQGDGWRRGWVGD